eukprot:GFUD01007291.1.p1 GENE.GFUD01007291.1~~GFUD01007291.1.p1  ORF type:complete len:346 (+),score=62.36 GFUD01007291.1:348-1385(+)
MNLYVPFLFCISKSFSFGFQPSAEEKNIYVKNRLDRVCSANGSKTRLNVKHEVVSVFTFNSSFVSGNSFKCHLELYLPSSSYGFSVFIEEMSLSGSSLSGCGEDSVQFGRDILFVTTHLSQKYCGEVELPVPRSKNGVMSFDFPFTPLARRIYNEEEDREMDIWLNINTRDVEDNRHKTLTLVVTPFKKSCASRDSLYQQCRFSTKCVRRELFCDGRINCAWPYVEPADEVHCLEALAPEAKSLFATDLAVILLVLSVLVGMIAVLVLAVNKYSKKVTKMSANLSADLFCNRQLLEDQLDRNGDRSDSPYLPSCPPLPPPPPYTAVDNLQNIPPPSYSLLIPRST